MSCHATRIALGALALAAAGGSAAADRLLIAAGVGASAAGPQLAGDLELRLGAAMASARSEHGQTVLIGFDLANTRRTDAARWDDACVARLRAVAATARCWDGAVQREPRVTGRALGGALGVRRDGGRLDAVGELRLHPMADLADVIELGVTLPVAGSDAMYIDHARLSPGWYVRTQWRLSLLRFGGEVGMTGLATRTSGTPRADAYAIATLAVAVAL
ncbi:MAG TPA: hypothetical protein VHT91_27265 [Kofleriaceae bacterium]|jgi:hypothetical protein|nr:hypothetical protein [Kofleriaceae bacterium]